MEPWQQALRDALTDPALLAARFGVDPAPLQAVAERYPLRITPHYLRLIEAPGDPLWRQCVPDPAELLQDDGLPADPLCEAHLSPVEGLVHRYPDRGLLLVSSACALYCRFCTRKRAVGCGGTAPTLDAALDHIGRTPTIREVILSGGDPLLLDDDRLAELLGRLGAIPHVETLRIHSRAPVVLPERIGARLCAILRRSQPLYLITHFNHPRELTPEAIDACARLADAGIPLGNQSVLLAGVNDDATTLEALLRGLLRMRVRPYYLHHGDLVAGTGHLRTSIESGLALIASLRGRLPGLAIPQYVIDLPGGRGKVPLVPQMIETLGPTAIIRAANGERIAIPNRCP